MTYLLFTFSFVLLFFGADYTVSSAEKIGKVLKLPALFVGVILVGFGTSLPEFFVSQIAYRKGEYDMGIGNLVGSNIGNFFMILGIVSLIVPLDLSGKNERNTIILNIVISSVLLFISSYQKLDYLTLGVCFSVFLVNVFLLVRSWDKSPDKGESLEWDKKFLLKFFAGVALLYGGGEVLIWSAGKICEQIGLSSYLISIIALSFGTSFPELVTSLVALKRKAGNDLIIGNILGSNLFNLALVMGSLGFFQQQFFVDFELEAVALILGSVFLLLLNIFKFKLGRIAGLGFISLYSFFIWFWVSLYSSVS